MFVPCSCLGLQLWILCARAIAVACHCLVLSRNKALQELQGLTSVVQSAGLIPRQMSTQVFLTMIEHASFKHAESKCRLSNQWPQHWYQHLIRIEAVKILLHQICTSPRFLTPSTSKAMSRTSARNGQQTPQRQRCNALLLHFARQFIRDRHLFQQTTAGHLAQLAFLARMLALNWESGSLAQRGAWIEILGLIAAQRRRVP